MSDAPHLLARVLDEIRDAVGTPWPEGATEERRMQIRDALAAYEDAEFAALASEGRLRDGRAAGLPASSVPTAAEMAAVQAAWGLTSPAASPTPAPTAPRPAMTRGSSARRR